MENTPTAPTEAPQAPASVWKKIPLTDGKYLISTNGEVARVLKNGGMRKLSPYKNNTPYLSVKICDNSGKCMNKYVHRLVAENFLDRSEEGVEVNHINGDKCDNRRENLEWVTRSENERHKATVLKTASNGNQVEVAELNGSRVFSSIADAARFLCVSTTTIRRHLEGYTKSVKGIKLIRKENIQ